jgi:ABC-2 type transport system ATP-binding protein
MPSHGLSRPTALSPALPSRASVGCMSTATIEARGLSKRFRDRVAVDKLTFNVRPGVVTGFLGPNGAGKTTTMRMILGLDAPTAGTVTVAGQSY